MFRKLISNLPFQPSLLGDVVFYTNRLQKEDSIRRLGLILIIIGFGLQIFTIAFPPASSLATNRADIVYGASSKEDVLRAYRQNEDQLGRKDIRAIFNHYGIAEAQIRNSKLTTIKDNNENYINTSRSTTKWADTFIPIEGAIDGGIYEFPLTYWRKNEYPNGYPALSGITSYGFKFWILLKGCGNIVYEKGAKKPNLEIKKDLISSPDSKVGSEVKYDILFRNNGAINAKNTEITDELPSNLEYKSHSSSADLDFNRSGNKLTWKVKGKDGALASTEKWHQIQLTATATKSNVKKVCNTAYIDASNSSRAATEEGSCITIQDKTCPGTGLAIPPEGIEACVVSCPDGSQLPYNQSCPSPQLTCEELSIEKIGSWNQRKITANTVSQPGSEIEKVVLYVNDKQVKTLKKITQNVYDTTYEFSSEGNYIIQVKAIPKVGYYQESHGCKVVENITKPDIQEVILTTSKKVSNKTLEVDDANNTTANPGDELIYSLYITNKGDMAAKNLSLNGEYAEDVRDILEYADIKDLGDGVLNKETAKITWNAVDINPGQTISKQFSAVVKDPLPSTPVSLSNPLSYDYILFNEYGNTVEIKLSKPLSKNIEESVSVLPNTGVGTSSIVMSMLVVIISYFYFRNRLLIKELKLIQQDNQAGGF